MTRLAVLILVTLSLARPARAELVTIGGVELAVPDGWSRNTTGAATTLSSPQSKSRAISVIELPRMPGTDRESLEKLLGNAENRVVIASEKVEERDGTKYLAATGEVLSKAGKVQLLVHLYAIEARAVMVISFVEAGQDPAIAKANEDILATARIAGPRLTVKYLPPRSPRVASAPPQFVAFISALAPKLDELFRFPRPLPIILQECGQVNAFYSPQDHTIRICHEFFGFLDALYRRAGYAPQQIAETTQNTVIFAFFHEFGHALVGELGLPIVGKGEDAADELATIFLSTNELGQKIALAAATWFNLMAQLKQRVDYADEHSLDQQRIAAIVCLLYGANKRYGELARAVGMTRDRMMKCDRDWVDRNKAWEKLLAPYFVAKPH